MKREGKKGGAGMNYEELIKALRSCAENFGCPIECPRYSPADEGVRACVSRLEKDAAAAIEELSKTVKDLTTKVECSPMQISEKAFDRAIEAWNERARKAVQE